LSGADYQDAEYTDVELAGVVSKLKTGYFLEDLDEFIRGINKDVTFYVVGLKTNSARLSVKFIYRRQFGELFRNLVQHQLDLKISQQSRPISLNTLTKELVSPKSSKQTVDTSLQVKILESILYGWRYPSFLLQTVVRRIQTDSDTEENRYIQMNDTRMGILKACINRDDRLSGREEEIKMALDKDNKTPAYLCGRLFAVLENIQQRASGYDLNRTIKDAYFTSASTRPALVFPKLLTLAQHHMRKMENDYYADLGIEEILSDLGNEFPTILSLKEQGVFMLGYYQQKHAIREQIKAYKEDK
jgi:CRISPR-associated protein Csd1